MYVLSFLVSFSVLIGSTYLDSYSGYLQVQNPDMLITSLYVISAFGVISCGILIVLKIVDRLEAEYFEKNLNPQY